MIGIKECELNSIYSIALEMLDDIEHIYGKEVNRHECGSSEPGFKELEDMTGFLKNGELLVVATRSEQLRKGFILQIAYQVAFSLKQEVAIFSANESLLRFTRKLVDLIADIPSNASIYDGQLNEAEFQRLATALVKLGHAPIYMNQGRLVILDDLCEKAMRRHRQSGEIGLILVDYTQQIMDGNFRVNDHQHSLIRFKKLAIELMVPVIAIYQLDPVVENHPSTLTRFELVEIERLSPATDGVMLMSGTPERLIFTEPKISKYKRSQVALEKL